MRLHPELGIIPYIYTGRISEMGLTQFEIGCARVRACLEVRSNVYGIRSCLMLTADDNLASWRPESVGMALKLADAFSTLRSDYELICVRLFSSARLSLRTKLENRWMDFHEIWHWRILQQNKEQTPGHKFTNELYRPSDRRLSANFSG
jgi:hypothetical protein